MPKIRTKRVIQVLLLTGTFISMFYVPWPIIWTWIQPLPDTVQEQVDDAINHGFDGIIAYVDVAGKPSKTYTAGWHNKAKKIPARPDAYFKIASISKLYDAVAVTKLVSSGKLSLDKTLADYFPELSDRIENADRITLRMMVQHRSGIPNLTDTPNFWSDPPANSDEALQLILDLPADFEPGEDYAYSNTNYLLIHKLIEKITGDDRFAYIKSKILEPLGLKHTFGSLDEVNNDDVMSGYYVGIEEDIKDSQYGSKLTSMLATAEDVGIFLRALNDGSVFNGDEQEIYSSIYVYNHTGYMPGYQSIAEYHKDIDAVVVQFTNTTNFQGYEWNISEIIYNRIIKILQKEQD
ncbi:MAG: serine hydrolase [Cytophagaceae bacterium]|nr:serine hydrolase [Cytophagaceae bacterium]